MLIRPGPHNTHMPREEGVDSEAVDSGEADSEAGLVEVETGEVGVETGEGVQSYTHTRIPGYQPCKHLNQTHRTLNMSLQIHMRANPDNT